jgi:hypothetical protein
MRNPNTEFGRLEQVVPIATTVLPRLLCASFSADVPKTDFTAGNNNRVTRKKNMQGRKSH